MEQSAIKEAGNILSSAYMNALSDFMGMMLLPSPPSLARQCAWCGRYGDKTGRRWIAMPRQAAPAPVSRDRDR